MNMGSNNLVDFRNYKSILNNLFFSDNDVIKKGSTQYNDFWKFYEKYLRIAALKEPQFYHKEVKEKSKLYKFPIEYNKKHCLNFSLNYKSLKILKSKLIPVDLDEGKPLTDELIIHFNLIVHLFLDFVQIQKFKKLKKLRESQKNLPIFEYKNHILETICNNEIVILAGDTGCGKSTQVPQYLLSSNFSNIACTQPRRIACISLCKRVSYESLNEYGSTIGYQIRFEKKKTEHSKVIFLTEGLLLRQITTDPTLSMYNVLILDEIHERHLQTDFLLGIVKCLIMQRPDIRIILMSATINIDLFSKYFLGKAPVIQIPGRLYPIELKYFPISDIEKSDKSGGINPSPYIRILQLIDKIYPSDERGDLLIFLSGIKEITTIVEAARLYAQQTNKWIVLPLHSTLSVSEQEKVFDLSPEGVRKCIISTNIAETSVTIDGVRFVVDSGKVKEMNYDSVQKMQKLKEFWVSQASAEQRKGRAGRTGPGVCYRLFSEKEYTMLSQYSVPEIQRVPIDSLILQMISLGLPNIRLFPFIDPPPNESIETSLNSLKSHSALKYNEELTQIGKILSQIPLDISLGKILIMGSLFHELGPVLSIVSAMSVQSPFTARAYRDPDCAERNKALHSDHGDAFTLLAVYREWLYIKTDRRENSRKWCKKRGLEEQRFYEMTKLRQQFTEMLKENGLQDLSGVKPTSSNERMKRLGELSLLKKIKKNLYNEGPKRAKLLKLDNYSADLDDDREEERDVNLEIKDIDFKIRYDDERLLELYKASKIKSSKELILLKIILCSGLYPNIALADEHNNYKPSSEQFFHTKAKSFVALHPNCVFSYDPQVLQLTQSDIIENPSCQSSNRYPFSSRHQVITFISLLETNKAYMVNSFRVPAAQILVLFSQNIDTNTDFLIIVFDNFIELTFLESTVAQNLIFQAVKLRTKWWELLNLRIKAKSATIENSDNLNRRANQLESDLSVGLTNLYTSEPIYSIKRLLDADIKVLHKGYCLEEVSSLYPNPFTGEICSPNTVKGGVNLTDYLTYDCLIDLKSTFTSITSFDSFCPYCDAELHLSSLERLAHMNLCLENMSSNKEEESVDSEKMNPNNKEFFCEICRKTFWFSIKDILKHKSVHRRTVEESMDNPQA